MISSIARAEHEQRLAGVLSSVKEIRRLAPQVGNNSLRGPVDYGSATLPALLAERAKREAFPGITQDLVDLLQVNSQGQLKVEFDPRPGPDTTCLKLDKGQYNSPAREVGISFGNNTASLSQIALNEEGFSSHLTIEGYRGRALLKNPNLIPDLLQAVQDDLRQGRQRWAKQLDEKRDGYFEAVAQARDPQSARLVRAVLAVIQKVNPTNHYTVTGDEKARTDTLTLYTTLPVDESLAYDIEKHAKGFDRTLPPFSTCLEPRRDPWGEQTTPVVKLNYTGGQTIIVQPVREMEHRSQYDKEANPLEIDFHYSMSGTPYQLFTIRVSNVYGEQPIGNQVLLLHRPNSVPMKELYPAK